MATQPPDRPSRDERLDALSTAVSEWAESELTRLDNEAAFLRQVLEGRGAPSAGVENLEAVSPLVQVEVDAYLEGP